MHEQDCILKAIELVSEQHDRDKVLFYFNLLDQEHKKYVPYYLIINDFMEMIYICEYGNYQYILQCLERNVPEFLDKVKYEIDDLERKRLISSLLDEEALEKYIPKYIGDNMKLYQNFLLPGKIKLIQYGYDIKYVMQYLEDCDDGDYIKRILANYFSQTWVLYPESRDIIQKHLQVEFINNDDVTIYGREKLEYNNKKRTMIQYTIKTNLEKYNNKFIGDLIENSGIEKQDNMYIITAFRHRNDKLCDDVYVEKFLDIQQISKNYEEVFKERIDLYQQITKLEKENYKLLKVVDTYKDSIDKLILEQNKDQ